MSGRSSRVGDIERPLSERSYLLHSKEGTTETQALPLRTSPYLTRSRSETRRKGEGAASMTRRNRSKPNKLHREKDVTTNEFASDHKRQFTLEQFDRRPR
ncbi:hypothetical protein TNCT_695571 [Trichonephila clavata]|uniref:Uncharacterized protein n=1 Tax=Trichonephila clavata TaxID=2740835 RepID=A0A8X6GZQ2_TRICU|nr:hypothetical protein TNCT_695571 [Trichonephila clavata]